MAGRNRPMRKKCSAPEGREEGREIKEKAGDISRDQNLKVLKEVLVFTVSNEESSNHCRSAAMAGINFCC